jgi:AraC family transcriptional regulator
MATTQRTSAAGHTLPGSKLRRVTEHIQAHLDQDLTLAHLGAVVYMSPSHFARRFQHSTGLPPHRFVVRQRIARARRVLTTPEESIAKISRLVGFRTPSHLTTVFRDAIGVTPEASRAAAVQEDQARREGG